MNANTSMTDASVLAAATRAGVRAMVVGWGGHVALRVVLRQLVPRLSALLLKLRNRPGSVSYRAHRTPPALCTPPIAPQPIDGQDDETDGPTSLPATTGYIFLFQF